ncbi:MAG: hypothetical protein HQK49_09095 [Oligoflexia bacterium]|nr:hypothetical protein [Oligoflexia bacterium]
MIYVEILNTKTNVFSAFIQRLKMFFVETFSDEFWSHLVFIIYFLIAILLVAFFSTDLFADVLGGGGFEAKVKGLQDKFLNVILPIMAVFGLGYAGILAATGNESAKGKIVLCLIGSAVAFLAPYIIAFVQSAIGH